jgi:Flp pilus assembly CpaE family ATPase
MHYNLLAFSNDPRLNERLQAALGAECSILFGDPRSENPDVAKRFEPNGIIMDADAHAGARTVLERIGAVRAQFAAVPLIVIGDEMSAQMILAAFRSGADDFIDREAADMEIRSQILAALRDRAAKNGRGDQSALVSILSAAPNDEDYDLALNTAVLLAKASHERRVLLLDLSLPASPARPALGLDLSFRVASAVREIARLDRAFLDSALSRASESGLYVLPLADSPADTTVLPAQRDLFVLLQILRSLFDAVVVYWGAFSRQAVIAGAEGENQHFYLGCNQRFSAIRNAKDFLAEVKTAEKGFDPILAVQVFDPALAPGSDDIIRVVGARRHLALQASWSQMALAQNRGRPLALTGPSQYVTTLRTHLAEEGLLPSFAHRENWAPNLMRWLSRERN